jgi:hypothetical protein
MSKKSSAPKIRQAALPPAFPKIAHAFRPPTPAVLPGAKEPKRANLFSLFRDLHEDRGERQMKTSHNPQTLPHGH